MEAGLLAFVTVVLYKFRNKLLHFQPGLKEGLVHVEVAREEPEDCGAIGSSWFAK